MIQPQSRMASSSASSIAPRVPVISALIIPAATLPERSAISPSIRLRSRSKTAARSREVSRTVARIRQTRPRQSRRKTNAAGNHTPRATPPTTADQVLQARNSLPRLQPVFAKPEPHLAWRVLRRIHPDLPEQHRTKPPGSRPSRPDARHSPPIRSPSSYRWTFARIGVRTIVPTCAATNPHAATITPTQNRIRHKIPHIIHMPPVQNHHSTTEAPRTPSPVNNAGSKEREKYSAIPHANATGIHKTAGHFAPRLPRKDPLKARKRQTPCFIWQFPDRSPINKAHHPAG